MMSEWNRILCSSLEDRRRLTVILAENGYIVRWGKTRPAGTKGAYTHYVEYMDKKGGQP